MKDELIALPSSAFLSLVFNLFFYWFFFSYLARSKSSVSGIGFSRSRALLHVQPTNLWRCAANTCIYKSGCQNRRVSADSRASIPEFRAPAKATMAISKDDLCGSSCQPGTNTKRKVCLRSPLWLDSANVPPLQREKGIH